MRSHEMNLLDFCKAILRGLYRAAAWVVSRLGDMIRLTYRRWWIVLLVVLLCVTAALYYARTSNRMYEVNAVATLNGVTNEMVRHAFEALDKVNPSFTQQNPATMLGIEEELAEALSRFKAYDVIDLLADSTVDVIDYRGRVSRMDTLCVHMPHMVALQFRTKLPNRLAEVEEAVLQYLNTRPYFQALYASYHAGLVREARFHRDQVDKLDSLTSVFYFAHNASTQVQLDAWSNGLVLGSRSVELFLEEVYAEMRESEYVQARLAVCTAPVVLQTHFVAEPCAKNGPWRMSALAVLVGWILGLMVAAVVEYRQRIAAWLQA